MSFWKATQLKNKKYKSLILFKKNSRKTKKTLDSSKRKLPKKISLMKVVVMVLISIKRVKSITQSLIQKNFN